MDYEHQLPEELNPTGDICVPIFIPAHPDYISLLLGVLGTLEQENYYERDANYDNENAKIVVTQWRERTITPLIEALASTDGCEVATVIKSTAYNKDLVTNKTTTSTTFVTMAASDISHTFTHPNVIIRGTNIPLHNSGANDTEGKIELVGETPISEHHARNGSTAAKELSATAIYANVPTGVAKTIRIAWKVAAGTGTAIASTLLSYEIEEWE